MRQIFQEASKVALLVLYPCVFVQTCFYVHNSLCVCVQTMSECADPEVRHQPDLCMQLHEHKKLHAALCICKISGIIVEVASENVTQHVILFPRALFSTNHFVTSNGAVLCCKTPPQTYITDCVAGITRPYCSFSMWDTCLAAY